MSTIPFYTPLPAFQTGDIVSATRLNQALSNLDAVYGLDQRISIGTTYGRTTWLSNGLQEWRGWVAFRGDQLSVYLQEASRITFDCTEKVGSHFVDFTSGGLKTIPLTGYGYVENDVYCVKVDGGLAPLYAYMSNSGAASVGTMPTFTNGTLSSAAHLNTVLTATETLGEQFNQPLPCGTRWNKSGTDWQRNNDQTDGTLTMYIQHRHAWFQFYVTATTSSGTGPGDVVKWIMYDGAGNGHLIWSREIMRVSGLGTYQNWGIQKVRLSDFATLTVGNWYKFRFEHEQNGTGSDGRANLYWCGEQRTDTAALWTPQDHWELGTVIEGSAGDPPRLDTFSANLTYLNGRRNTTNMVQRQARLRREDNERTEMLHGRRIHRWLAYENATESDTPTLYYTTDRLNVFSSVTMKTTYTTLYLDLDTTPVKPGMVFYVANCHYAIQVSDHRSTTPPTGLMSFRR